MDLPYDQTQEDAFGQNPQEQKASLEEDLQEAYKAFSASPWGARIGGFLGNVVKQGGTVYNEASQEFAAIGQDASKGLSGLRQTIISHTRSLSINASSSKAGGSSGDDDEKDGQATPTRQHPDTAEHEATVLEKLRVEAAKRLKDIQKAEDAADEALLKFGASVRDFLQNAISIAPPAEDDDGQAAGAGGVRFESKDAQGKRVIHASRYDAQLHVVHTSVDSLRTDPTGDEFAEWAKGFDVDKKTDDISTDLTAYPELRTTMETLVPDQVSYVDFWKRYYFLRHGIETAEARRRDLLKAASADNDVKWDDDSEESGDDEDDSEDDDDETDNEKLAKEIPKDAKRSESASSSTTLNPTKPAEPTKAEANKADVNKADANKSTDDKSVADSEASYDLVGAASGAPSRTSGSPTDRKADESDSEDDWE